jgi:hypothetical protein
MAQRLQYSIADAVTRVAFGLWGVSKVFKKQRA